MTPDPAAPLAPSPDEGSKQLRVACSHSVGGVTDDYDTLKNTYWIGDDDILALDRYFGWRSACQKIGGVPAVCFDLGWDKEDAATAMGVLAALFSIGSAVLVAVKLCKPNKLVNIIGCVVAFLAIIFTIACFAMWADVRAPFQLRLLPPPPCHSEIAQSPCD